MDSPNRTAALRLPTEPYPGLRPFLDHEAALLLGRGRQVREIIARLRETRFVAVIGGSGSGKSSLIRAGVVPELRGFGIAEAGDYWVPVVCTPGTTLLPAPDAEGGPIAQTPITRLAWKYSQLLTPTGTDDGDAERRAEIAAVFRQEAGFSRLVDAYFDELPARGPDGKDARFLFVVDQFEELFHPNNRDNADARQLIESVIDHFFNPHPRCYVVLTMRSEHLADCAGYLELPDAINKSSYLVRRLDERELREAIVGPAKYYLRLLQRRGGAAGQALPDDVVFDDAVIERLLADVARITSDADHLPLLQHVLARTWEAACRREGVPADHVPARVTWVDLEQAVAPGAERMAGWLHQQADANCLRRSLENQAEAIYQGRPPAERAQIDTVLRHLAFKDPNNGLYSQQRIDVDDPRLFAGIDKPRATLHALLEHGFLDTVNYLFWDKENPERITLKVSHESFIRGWSHFRALVDAEADRFDEFVAVLRKCAMWSERPEFLLEASELMRFDAYRLGAVFDDPAERRDWFRVLLQHRDGERLARVGPRVDAFIAESRARQQAQEQARRDAAAEKLRTAELARARQQRRYSWSAAVVTGVIGLALLWWTETSLGKKERTLHRSYALAAETQVGFAGQVVGIGGAQTALYATLLGASLFDEGSRGGIGPAAWPGPNLLYQGRLDGVLRTRLLSEVRNSTTLGSVLRGAVWALDAPAAPAPAAPAGTPAAAAAVSCDVVAFSERSRNVAPRGASFFARPGAGDGSGLIVAPAGPGSVSLYSGRRRAEGRECSVESQLLATPLEATRLALASDLSNVVVGFPGYWQFYAVLWADRGSVQMRPRAVVSRQPDDVDAAAPGTLTTDAVTVLAAVPRAFASDLRLGPGAVRLYDMEPTSIGAADAQGAAAMQAAPPNSPCAVFANATATTIGLGPQDALLHARVSEDGEGVSYCLHVKSANQRGPDDMGPTLASLYRVRGSGEAHAIESSTPLFIDLVLGATRPEEVRIDAHAGWLAFRTADQRWLAVPWGLEAWRELARGVFDPRHVPAPGAMFRLIVGDERVPDVGASIAARAAVRLPVRLAPTAR
ncbi:MAG: hypothetical protein ABI702_12300 [Burkholderiales bacterium]